MNSMRFSVTLLAAAVVVLAATHVEAGIKCDFCQAIVTKIKEYHPEEIIALFEKEALQICEQLDGDQIDLCKEKLKDFVERAEDMLQHSPKEICQQLGVCSQDAAYLRQLMGNRKDLREIERLRDSMMANYGNEIRSLLATRTTSFVGCETCVMVLKQIQQLVEMPQVQNAIDKAIELTCQKLAGSNVEDCIEQSKAYVHEGIKFVQEQDPHAICAMFGECDSLKSNSSTRNTEGILCHECKKVVDTIKAKLEDKDVRDNIEVLITQVCNQFPDDATRQQCHQYTSQIIDEAIELLESSTSVEICQAINVC